MTAFWQLEQHGDAVAVIGEDETQLTYRQLAQSVSALAEHLPARALVFVCATTAPTRWWAIWPASTRAPSH